MRKTVIEILLFATLFASPYATGQGLSGPASLPKPSGPFPVGRVDYDWIDASRPAPTPLAGEAHRELMVHVWYPAAAGQAAGPRVPYISNFVEVQRVVSPQALQSFFRPAPYPQIESAGLPETHAIRGAVMPKDQARYPVLVFSHGLGLPTAFYTAALEDLASHGFVVAAIDHTEENAFTVFPGPRIVPYAGDVWTRGTAQADGAIRFIDRRIEEIWAPDIRFVITQLTRYNGSRALGAPFAGRLDLQRLGAFGHSMGGLAAVRACQMDTRIRACADEDADNAGSPFIHAGTEQLKKPLLFFTAATSNVFKASFVHPSDADLASMNKTREQYDADVKRVQANQNDALANVGAASYRVFIDRPSFIHRSFSDLTLLAAAFDRSLAPEALRDFEIAQSYVRAFFDRHLGGASDSLMDQPVAPYPGVRIDRFGMP